MAALLAPAGEALVLAVVAPAPVLALAQVAVHRAHRVPLRRLAQWPVLAKVPRPVPAARSDVVALAEVALAQVALAQVVPVQVVPVEVRVVAGPVAVPAVRLLNRPWFSPVMARTTL